MRHFGQLLPAFLVWMLALALPTQATPDRWVQEGWRTDFSKSAVDLARIISGGPARDGIPPLDDPKFEPVSAISDLGDTEPVIELEINGEAKAYPLRVLTWHEIANDVIGGEPVAVTFCPLCNSSLVFRRTVDGAVLDFGTTGKLKDSNLVMYDRQTDSWWQQFTGEAIAGTATGRKLERIASTVVAFADFAERHPEGLVLVPNDPTMRNYGRNPYVGYDLSGFPFLYDGLLPPGINPMQYVVVVTRDGDRPFAVTLSHLAERGTVSHSGYDLSWGKGLSSVLDQGEIAKGRDIGAVSVIHDGKPAIHDVTFAFVAHAFHPGIEIIAE